MLWIAVLPFLSAFAEPLPSSGVSFDAPVELIEGLADAAKAIGAVRLCSETDHEIEARLAKLERGYEEALRRGRGIWGNAVFDEVEQRMVFATPPSCRRTDLDQAMSDADAALRVQETGFADAVAAIGRGAWAGPLQLCRATVAKVEAGFDGVADQPVLLVVLQPSLAGLLSSLTARSINGPLDLRLEGEVISEPIVLERIDGGELQITGPELPVLYRLSEAVKKPC